MFLIHATHPPNKDSELLLSEEIPIITDKSNSSVDSYSIKVADIDDDVSTSFPIHFDIIRLLGSTNADQIVVKINTEQGLSMFEIDTSYSKLKYVVPGLQV